MNFQHSEDQLALRDLARQILTDKLTNDRLKELANDPDGFDRETWGELAKANLLGASLPESVGGSGLGFTEVALLLQEIGRAVAPVPAFSTLVLAALPIARFGDDAQNKRWLPGVASGDAVLSGAIAELGGVEPTRPRLAATQSGSGFRLDGEKSFVPAFHLAEHMLVTARTGDDSAGLFVVGTQARGLTAERQETTAGEPQFLVTFDGVEVPAVDALGDPRAGFDAVEWTVARARAARCAIQLGSAERMLEMTAEYGRERQQFGRPIGSFQAFHTRAADAYIAVEALRLATWETTWQLDSGLDARESLQIARFWAGAPAYRVAYACSHLHGGIGSDTDYPLHRYYLWIKQHELTLGSGGEALRELGADLAAAG